MIVRKKTYDTCPNCSAEEQFYLTSFSVTYGPNDTPCSVYRCHICGFTYCVPMYEPNVSDDPEIIGKTEI